MTNEKFKSEIEGKSAHDLELLLIQKRLELVKLDAKRRIGLEKLSGHVRRCRQHIAILNTILREKIAEMEKQ